MQTLPIRQFEGKTILPVASVAGGRLNDFMKTSPTQAISWETSLTYLVSRLSPLMAQALEKRLCQELQLECRHVGLLNYLYDAGGSLRLGPENKRSRRAPAPSTTLEIIQLFGEVFWGPQLDQKQADLQVPTLLGPLEELGLVRRVFDELDASIIHLLLTVKGKAARKKAMKLILEVETEFLARFSGIFPESLTCGLLDLRRQLLENSP